MWLWMAVGVMIGSWTGWLGIVFVGRWVGIVVIYLSERAR